MGNRNADTIGRCVAFPWDVASSALSSAWSFRCRCRRIRETQQPMDVIIAERTVTNGACRGMNGIAMAGTSHS